jgi:murein L,D-transpeptidase YafK
MQSYDLKLPKNYKAASNKFYIALGGGLIALLVTFNVVFLTLFIGETKTSENALRVLQETSRSLLLIQDSLGKADIQKASVHLADARHQIDAVLSTAPELPPAKNVSKSKIPQAKQPVVGQKQVPVPLPAAQFSIPAGEMPASLGCATTGEYSLICEKESKRLHLFKYQDKQFGLVKSYPCIVGANGTDKKKEGDHATPKGSYFSLRYTPGGALQGIYGEGAFVLNYPNFLDRKARKNGGGIWIHGHCPSKVVGTGDLMYTKGCIAVSNDAIKELRNLINPNGASVSIVDRITFVKENDRQELLREVFNFIDAWRQAWESNDTGRYLSYYSNDFINSDGMDFTAFRRHKERVNRGKKFIRVKTEQVSVVFPQERGGDVAAVRFALDYRSSNFKSRSKKLFYLKRGQEGWAIFGEADL